MDKQNIRRRLKKSDIDFRRALDVCKKLSENRIKTIYFRDKEMKN